jgi:hypothetical protein
VEERLLPGRVQVAQLALQRFMVQPMGIEAELPRHAIPLSARPLVQADPEGGCR